MTKKGLPPFLYRKQPSLNNPIQTYATTAHTPKAAYKDAENSNTIPNNSKQTSCQTLSTTVKSSGPATVDEPPQCGEPVHDVQWAPRQGLQKGNDSGAQPPPNPMIRVSSGAPWQQMRDRDDTFNNGTTPERRRRHPDKSEFPPRPTPLAPLRAPPMSTPASTMRTAHPGIRAQPSAMDVLYRRSRP